MTRKMMGCRMGMSVVILRTQLPFVMKHIKMVKNSRLLPLPQIKNGAEGRPFCFNRRNSNSCDE